MHVYANSCFYKCNYKEMESEQKVILFFKYYTAYFILDIMYIFAYCALYTFLNI